MQRFADEDKHVLRDYQGGCLERRPAEKALLNLQASLHYSTGWFLTPSVVNEELRSHTVLVLASKPRRRQPQS